MSLLKELYRFDCTGLENLQEFALNNLSDQEANEVRQHLDVCPICREELLAYTTIASDSDAILPLANIVSQIRTAASHAYEVLDNVRWLVANASSAPPLQAAGVYRSDDGHKEPQSWSTLYEVEDYGISLVARSDGKQSFSLLIRLLTDKPPSRISYQLLPEDPMISPLRVVMEKERSALFERISAGCYGLIITVSESRILLPRLIFS